MSSRWTQHRRFGAGTAALVAAAMIGTVISGPAFAANRTQESRAATTAVTLQGIGNAESRLDLSSISDEAGEAAIQKALDLIGSIPESLIQRVEAGDQGALQEIADFLNQSAGAQPATRGWFQCTTAVAKFAAENGIGIAKVYRIIKNGKKVAKAVWNYIKHKKYPGHIDDDIANLIVNSTGLPALAEACL
ncbi:hypothetical protein [Streptomyces sp. AN091965]|uniref:hypothetical protein n=1 Tax=Streptomyces sp. AN091965 TaxID=2927803 RepID=UPI001F620D04|nr:hypothetical protein [Streptomyces sp. AN091965]MCI3929182.1 hypothetical protein [Streptomyces sp. AN091965]